MNTRLKYGLIAGSVSMILMVLYYGIALDLMNGWPIIVYLALYCLVNYLAVPVGAVAGLLAAYREKPTTKCQGARAGAAAGGVAGALLLVGQVIGAIGVLILTEPPQTTLEVPYYLRGLSAWVAFGLLGVLVSVLVGSCAGFLGTLGRPVGQLGGDKKASVVSHIIGAVLFFVACSFFGVALPLIHPYYYPYFLESAVITGVFCAVGDLFLVGGLYLVLGREKISTAWLVNAVLLLLRCMFVPGEWWQHITLQIPLHFSTFFSRTSHLWGLCCPVLWSHTPCLEVAK